MHFKNENEMNSNLNFQVTTPTSSATTSCTSSPTDSGVVIVDNSTSFNRNNKNYNNVKGNGNNNRNNNNNTNSALRNNGKTAIDNLNGKICNDTTTTTAHCDKSNYQINTNTNTSTHNNEQNKSDNYNKLNNTNKHINIENIVNLPNTSKQNDYRIQIPISTDHPEARTTFSKKNCSPSLSIRSTTISIVSIDENAIDSSVVDSDSDDDDDDDDNANALHNDNCIVRNLGQQITYPPGSKDLPNINQGLTVVSQKIIPNSADPMPLAENILNNGLLCEPASALSTFNSHTPQIGSIAVSDSTDVTIGDKHFYEGSVTIQQFLINRADKWDENGKAAGQDNPSFAQDEEAMRSANDPNKAPSSPEEQPYKFIFNRKAIYITGTIIILTIVVGILIVMTSSIFKSSISKNPDEDFDPNDPLTVVSRDEWGAAPPRNNRTKLTLPVHRVIISHTATGICMDKATCINRVKVIQDFHRDSFRWDDIGYNHLIGGDGRVYVGRGFDNQGAHTKGYNTDSIGISFIGTFTTTEPTKQQLRAAQELIEEGVRRMKIAPDYHLYGARQLGATESPGEALYRIIKTWAHWTSKV